MSKALTIAKINLRQIKPAYFITVLIYLLMLANEIISLLIVSSADNVILSSGNTFFLLPVFAAIFIPSRNLRKIINLGGKRNEYFKGCLPVYVILSAFVALIIILYYYTVDRFMMNYVSGVINLIEVFGFIRRGPIVAFIQMFAFLFLFSVFIHTLTAAQDKWYGWAADIMLVAIISVFTPIAPLRKTLVWFFRAIIFHPSALFQIAFCLILVLAIYALNKPILARKAI